MCQGYHGSQSENVTFDIPLIQCTMKRRADQIKLGGAYPNTKSHTRTHSFIVLAGGHSLNLAFPK